MLRWWSVVLVLGVLVAWALADEECTKGCYTGYKCEIEQGESKCKISAGIIAIFVIIAVLLVILLPAICIGMCFCGAFACMPHFFEKTINRILHSDKRAKNVGRVSYTEKKIRAKRAIAMRKKKESKKTRKKGLRKKPDSGTKDDPEDGQNVFANKSFDQGQEGSYSGKSKSFRTGDAV
ncbi:hypothetical protein QR680_018548 [Steinernema hermaphroditum]|uniref:Uncharacterized protein n=1 Tax=Steinernema hermaphroditum TaxID=289476 RepID=A0AA39HJ86_9BILA|nr:hypothetical protein QR680_018548 [Steinernema hermaphroditum]